MISWDDFSARVDKVVALESVDTSDWTKSFVADFYLAMSEMVWAAMAVLDYDNKVAWMELLRLPFFSLTVSEINREIDCGNITIREQASQSKHPELQRIDSAFSWLESTFKDRPVKNVSMFMMMRLGIAPHHAKFDLYGNVMHWLFGEVDKCDGPMTAGDVNRIVDTCIFSILTNKEMVSRPSL